jgi:hypothetical protein
MSAQPNEEPRKAILGLTALAIVLTGLFPPWLYTFDKLANHEEPGWHSERSAGYFWIFKPPEPNFNRRAGGANDFVEPDATGLLLPGFYPYFGVKLDTTRLLVEWACILAVAGAAWGIALSNRPFIPEP